jgi:hypothetical protein
MSAALTCEAQRGPCGKRTYASERLAKFAHRHAGWRIRCYECRPCNGWHVTNEDKR